MIDLQFSGVSKKYRVRRELQPYAGGNSYVQKLKSLRGQYSDFWAVRDVCFQVKRGEALGIIGHNGAGKSTMLKLLASITSPTAGEITINGRLSALIEVGSGFHQELTGRENVYLNGSILGMRRREISSKLDSIFEFAGIREFIDTPVKRYSSGMFVRLGFSIAAHLDPDILLLDEVLAVGDAAFQAKCIQRITELKNAGTTIVFISHDLGAVAGLCDRVLLMERGRLIRDGGPREVITEYEQSVGRVELNAPPAYRHNGSLAKDAEIKSVSFSKEIGSNGSVQTGSPLRARMEVEVFSEIADAVFELSFFTQEGQMQCQLATDSSGEVINLARGRAAVEFFCDELMLLPGVYLVDAALKHRSDAGGDDIDWRYRCANLRVDQGKPTAGEFYVPHRWKLVEYVEANGAKADLTGEVLA